MKGVELYRQVRRAVYVEGMSRREAARRFGIDPRTVAKMLAFSVLPGYRRSQPPAQPKLDPFLGIIDRILEEDKGQSAGKKAVRKKSALRKAKPGPLRKETDSKSKSNKLVCRYCGSDDLAQSFIKRRDRRCRKCFSRRYGSVARARKAKVKK
jgi:hypothetical protein